MCSPKLRSKSKVLVLSIIFISILIASMDLVNYLPSEKNSVDTIKENNGPEYENNFPIFISQTPLNEYSGVGAPQNVTEFGQGFFQNNELNISKSENASIKVPNNWNASEILINVTNIYEYDKTWMNETFDNPIDSNYWSNSTTGDTNYFSAGLYDASGPNSSIYMRFDNGTNWNNANSYLNYSFELD